MRRLNDAELVDPKADFASSLSGVSTCPVEALRYNKRRNLVNQL